MAIPNYQKCMRPLLEMISDGESYRMRDLVERIADHFTLTAAERQQLLPSNTQTIISNRTHWAKTYLKKAGLVDSPVRGVSKITDEGLKLLQSHSGEINTTVLAQYDSFNEFKQTSTTATDESAEEDSASDETPEEALETADRLLRDSLASDLLEKALSCSPQFFEQLVVDLLVAMGYGGSVKDAGQALGKSGDGGIDGVIKEDKLGLDLVCIQAKRWQGTVGRPLVQAFAGSMEGFRARKGVLITTGKFSKDALDYIDRIERKIVLIDGLQLCQLMIEHNVGVSIARSYQVKKIDIDYFDSEDL
ncbi:Mrr restriction system protein [Polystyrenella longa]|uniref:Mrr restriction system protein n=1 Tax=Polystyrenella longa TaxID=2528007 RepID=A0A518CTQ9_9PLAN|nr:restriction endonuclease [Polystyrenella longa]QDU82622.1 Mrr restriction system protein [Polystyrenella longa]